MTSGHVVEDAAAVTKTSEDAAKIMGVANAAETSLMNPTTTEVTIAAKGKGNFDETKYY